MRRGFLIGRQCFLAVRTKKAKRMVRSVKLFLNGHNKKNKRQKIHVI